MTLPLIIPESAIDTAPEHEGLIDERKAARFFSVSAETLRLYRRRGQGPRFYRIGGRLVRYRMTDLIAWRDTQASARI